VATTVISDDNGKIIAACTKRLNSTEVNYGEGQAKLLATKLALYLAGTETPHIGRRLHNHYHGHQESKLHLGLDHRAHHRAIYYVLSSFPIWEAIKIPRQANLRAHIAAKWAASHNSYAPSLAKLTPFQPCNPSRLYKERKLNCSSI
jgi:hypothetical protein